jgi:phage gp29-like protein
MQQPPKSASTIAEALFTNSRWRNWSPVRELSPERLQGWLDQWRAGLIAPAARLFREIEERDDVVLAVASKRKAAVAACEWEVIQLEESPAAARHADALRFLYDNLVASDALDLDEEGDMATALESMADAIGSKYSVHEILWRASPRGLTAELRSVPLWFFERSTGRLTFQPQQTGTPGMELHSGEWLTTVSRTWLHKATAIAYLYKVYPLRDWLQYTERHGMPAFIGSTSARPDSDEWAGLEDAVAALASEFAAVVSESSRLQALDLGTQGELPYSPLVDRMDRAIATIWRGGDLSTLSRSNGVGAESQGEEAAGLLQADCKLLESTLNTQLGRWAIRYAFGPDTKPLAYLRLRPKSNPDQAGEIARFESAQRLRTPLSLRQIREELSLATPEDAADTLLPSLTPPPFPRN